MDIRTYPDELARLRNELGQCVSENNQLAENAAELGKALDVRIAERDEAFAELDAERNAHNATAAQLYAELAGAQDTATAAVQAWRTVTAELAEARAELDAMRQAHSVVSARMQAMGC